MLINQYLSVTDWAIILVTMLTSAIIGVIIKKNYRCHSEYLSMSRQLSLPMFTGTLVATWYGGILGVTQIAFEQGMYNFVTQGMCWYAAYLLFALVMVKKVRSMDAQSFPEMITRLVGARAGKIAAWILLIKTLPVAYAISIAIIIQYLVPVPLPLAIAASLIFCVCYMYRGGFRAVVYTDFFQCMLMLVAVACVLIFSIYKVGSLQYLFANLPKSHLEAAGTKSWSTIFIWFVIACSTTFLNPAFYQRCIAAKNTRTAITGIILATIIWMLCDVCTTFGGMYAKIYLPSTASEHAYLHYSMQILPSGLKGLFIAGLFAAALSTLDSFLFICGNLISYDLKLIKSNNPRTTHQYALLLASAATMALSLCFNTNIEEIWLSMKMYFIIALIIPLAIGYFFPKLINDQNFIIWVLTISVFYVITCNCNLN